MNKKTLSGLAFIFLIIGPPAVASDPPTRAIIGRDRDEIIVCGQPVHIGVPVVTWLDPGGYDAYNLERRLPEYAEKDASLQVKRGFGERSSRRLPANQREQIQQKGWQLGPLKTVVDQFVIHYDACGTSRYCFYKLHDERSLSIHFMLDIDGTIYQTLDLKERAWHATKANDRSIGIEIANIGAVPAAEFDDYFGPWYKKSSPGETLLTIPDKYKNSAIRDRSVVLKPSRAEPVIGKIHDQVLGQYDLTPQQYDSLIKLTAGLHATFPKIKLDYPRGTDGKLNTALLPDPEYDRYEGLLGHFHVQTEKTDPGPAFQWDKVIEGARSLAAPVGVGK